MLSNALTGAALLLTLFVQPSAPPEISAELIDALSPSTREEVRTIASELAKSPENPALYGRVGMLLQANQRLELAVQYYDRAIEIAPQEFPWVYYRAVCNETMRRLDAAESGFRRAAEIDPGYIPAQLHLAQLLADSARWAEAEEIYRSIVDRVPDLAVAHFGLGRSLEGLGEIGEAMKHYQQACRLHPSYGAAHYALGQLLRKEGDQEAARKELEIYQQNVLVRPAVGDGLLQAIDELKSGHPRALRMVEEALAASEQGDTEKAIELNREAIEISPGLAQAYVNLLILYGREGRFEEADETYRKGIAAAPNFGKLDYNYGVLLLQNNRPVEAYDFFLKALQVNPLNAEARINLGKIEELKGDFAEAERQYRVALQADPELRLARFNLARALIAQGRSAEGAEELEKIRTPEDDQSPLYLYALATARVREGKLEAALQAAEEARSLAEKYGRDDLIPAIDRDLEKLRAEVRK